MEIFSLNTLYIVRHGIAEDGFHKPDPERELTQKGRDRMHEIGKRLLQMEVMPTVIISSPYKRALQTAAILAAELHYGEEIHQDKRLIPMARYEDFCDLFFEYRSSQQVMMVGHEPSTSENTSAICGAGKLKLDFRKGSVAAIAIERVRPVQGTLLWYAPPSVLR